MAGNWEPLAFLRRAGGYCVNDERRYEEEHTEKMAKKLSAAGVTAVIWHCYKGLGFRIEKEEMEYTRRFGRHCRKHGIKLGTYINVGSFFAETFFLEKPQARNWLSRDVHGQPHSYSEYYRSYYRYRPCLTNRGFIDYVKKMARYAVAHVGSEWLHFDNVAQMPCYCDNCRKMFPEYLRGKYKYDTPRGALAARQRFGFGNLGQVVLPRGTARMPIDTLPSLRDPVLQEWVSYRCELLTRAIREISAAMSKLNPNLAITVNSSFDNGQFAPLVWGNNAEGFAGSADFLFSEDGKYPGMTPDRRLISHIGVYNLGAALDARILVHQPDGKNITEGSRISLALMEAAVFNQGTLGHVYWAPELLTDPLDKDPRPEAIRFIKKHSQYFVNTRPVSETALLYSMSSLLNNWSNVLQSKTLVEQVLIQYGVQYDTIVADQLSDLGKYQVLVLPNTSSLSDTHVLRIRRFIQNGGRVVATEDSAMCDEWGRRRFASGEERLLGESDDSMGQAQNIARGKGALAAVFGLKGKETERIFYVGKLKRARPFVWDANVSQAPLLNSRYVLLPENHKEIAQTLRKSLGKPFLLEIPAPSFVVPRLAGVAGGNKIVLHLLNYNPEHFVDQLTIGLRQSFAGQVERADTFCLENDRRQSFHFNRGKRGGKFIVPKFKVYRAIVFHLRGRLKI